MKLIYGLSAALLGTTLLAAPAFADRQDDSSSRSHHMRYEASDQVRTNGEATGRPRNLTPSSHGNSHANYNANANASLAANNPAGGHGWSHAGHGSHGNNSGHVYWNASNLHDHNVSHFNAQDRATWQHGNWQHGNHHGRNGWWWNSGGSWFFYDQPVYPYPGYVSNTYYDDDYYDGGDDGYAGAYAGPGDSSSVSPGDGGYYWYYCNNPAGYYPYVKSCRGPWRAVSPTPQSAQQGYDQNSGSDAYDDDRGPPPGYNDNGPQSGDQYNGPDDDDRGPPPGYNDDRGPPPGYDDGPDGDDSNGPPPR